MNYSESITQQQISIQRKSDVLLGRDKMDYDQFCNAIDDLIPKDYTMIHINPAQAPISTREMNKVVGKLIHDETGKNYYEIYLSIKFNTPLK